VAAFFFGDLPEALLGRSIQCPLAEVRAPPQQPLFTNFGKLRALANLLILVPVSYLKFLNRIRRL
jgi:hypothetical protein